MSVFLYASLVLFLMAGPAGAGNGSGRPVSRLAAFLRGLLRPARGRHHSRRGGQHTATALPADTGVPWGEAPAPDGDSEPDDSISPADFTQFDLPPGRVRRYARPNDSGSPM